MAERKEPRSWGFILRESAGEGDRWIGIYAPLEGDPPRRIIPYSIRIRVASSQGRLICTGIHLGDNWETGGEEVEITTRSLRELRLDEILTQLNRQQDSFQVIGMSGVIGRGSVTRPHRPGRRGHGDEHYQEVARVYREAAGRKPIQHLVEHFIVEESTARRWVREARKRGFLGAAIPGKAGELPADETKEDR